MLYEITESRTLNSTVSADIYPIPAGSNASLDRGDTYIFLSADGSVRIGNPDDPALYASGAFVGASAGPLLLEGRQCPAVAVRLSMPVPDEHLNLLAPGTPGRNVVRGFLTETPTHFGSYYHGRGFGFAERVTLSNPFRHLGGLWTAQEDVVIVPLSGEDNMVIATADDDAAGRRSLTRGTPYLIEKGTPFRILSPIINKDISFVIIGPHDLSEI